MIETKQIYRWWLRVRGSVEFIGLPKDFSPEGYLRLNKDVLLAGVDPTEHYLKFGIEEGRLYKDVRKDKLLGGLALNQLTGIEIGALCRPFVSREDGHIIYVDHTDTETLKKKYSSDPDVDIATLVAVDGVWGGNTLLQAAGRKVDYVIASHVVEHVPNLIGWLNEIESVLEDDGEIRLVVPDKRYTFDYRRRETGLADVAYANLVSARSPLPYLICDYVLNVVKLDKVVAWSRDVSSELLEHHHTLQDAINVTLDAINAGTYHDIHCWVFTPFSFIELFSELVRHDLINLECTRFFDTEKNTLEFFVGLKKSRNKKAALKSWLDAAEACRK
ncbi:methyltransferase domain-containing protein [Pseudomonas fluorescens]|uniref:methyltransferase domain-containing protein n=1 Tax=Pseudomonas fluorescens TaxID=294 RepID=UPI002ACB03DD|nr:methyltransferase domain-containing protein [Pseudomonas fluorescens]MDZ5434235.1 methyltransferase domain-containing protein [Pseudomonas fluorescens]